MEENELKDKIEALEIRLGALSNQVLSLQNAKPMLSIPLDTITRKTVGGVVYEDFFDAMWSKVFHHQTFFESLDGWSVTNSPSGSTVISQSDVNLTTGATSGNQNLFQKTPKTIGNITFTKDSAFRAVLLIAAASTANIVLDYTVGAASNNNYGFQLIGQNLYGRCRNNTTATNGSALLQTLSAVDAHLLEARFYAGSKVSFFVDGLEKGSLSTALPRGTAATIVTPSVLLTTTNNAVKSVFLHSFEFLQSR